MFYTCVNMLFWRVFMRISYSCPTHLKFSLTVEKWTGLVQMTSDAIDWLDAHETMYDVWMLVAYGATCCALVQVRHRCRLRFFDAQTGPIDSSVHCSTTRTRGGRTPRRR